MASFSVEIPNIGKLQKALEDSSKIAEPWLQKAIEASVAEIQKNATKGTVPWKTGYLVQSFGLGILIGRLIGRIAPTANYAIYVHEGTGPHEIRPKNGKALFWPGAAHPVAKVNHPGTKPNRFIPRILGKATPGINRHFERALELILGEIARKSS